MRPNLLSFHRNKGPFIFYEVGGLVGLRGDGGHAKKLALKGGAAKKYCLSGGSIKRLP